MCLHPRSAVVVVSLSDGWYGGVWHAGFAALLFLRSAASLGDAANTLALANAQCIRFVIIRYCVHRFGIHGFHATSLCALFSAVLCCVSRVSAGLSSMWEQWRRCVCFAAGMSLGHACRVADIIAISTNDDASVLRKLHLYDGVRRK